MGIHFPSLSQKNSDCRGRDLGRERRKRNNEGTSQNRDKLFEERA